MLTPSRNVALARAIIAERGEIVHKNPDCNLLQGAPRLPAPLAMAQEVSKDPFM
jgi:hypothetical protein